VECYKAEPYVMRRMLQPAAAHGPGGWTWYTGSAGWMYRLILETLLGVELVVDELRFTPKVPQEWRSFKLDYRHRETVYHITCLNVSGAWKVPPKIILDGTERPGAALKLVADRREHFVDVKFEM